MKLKKICQDLILLRRFKDHLKKKRFQKTTQKKRKMYQKMKLQKSKIKQKILGSNSGNRDYPHKEWEWVK